MLNRNLSTVGVIVEGESIFQTFVKNHENHVFLGFRAPNVFKSQHKPQKWTPRDT